MDKELYKVFESLMSEMFPAGTVLDGEQLYQLRWAFYAGIQVAARLDGNSYTDRQARRQLRLIADRFDNDKAPTTLTVKERE